MVEAVDEQALRLLEVRCSSRHLVQVDADVPSYDLNYPLQYDSRNFNSLEPK